MIVMNCAYGLGNRLFYFSHCLALAEATGHSVVSLDIPEAGTLFGGRHGVFCVWPKSSSLAIAWPLWVRRCVYVLFLKALGRWVERSPAWLKVVEVTLDNTRQIGLRDPKFLAMLRSHRLVIMRGWPDINQLEFPNPQAIRSFFSPPPRFASQAVELALKAKGDADVLIGVHCRWGDFNAYGDGCFFYPVQAYVRVMRHCAGLFPGRRVAFFVVTNEAERLGPSLDPFAGLQVTHGPGTVEGDLFGLAECDYIVCPASSFSLWAAFYGRKAVWCMDGEEALPTLEDFIVPENTFEGLHPDGLYRLKTRTDTQDERPVA